MKHNLYISLIALATLASCAKVEPTVAPDFQTGSQEKEIDFAVATYAAQTKAESSTSMSTTQSFKVYGIYTGSDSFDANNLTGAVDYIPGKVISYNNGAWRNASESYYWPKSGKLSFAAYSPASADLTYSRSNTMFSKTGYELAQEDLLIADLAANKEASTSAVPMTFRHALSQLNINVKSGELEQNGLTFEITLNSITVKGTSQKADFAWTSSDSKMSWSNYAADADDVLGNTAKALSTTAASYVAGRYVLPQSLEGASLEISYTLVTKNGETTMDTATLTDSVAIDGTIKSWNAGTAYTYNITINPLSSDTIQFVPSVTDWVNVDSRITL